MDLIILVFLSLCLYLISAIRQLPYPNFLIPTAIPFSSFRNTLSTQKSTFLAIPTLTRQLKALQLENQSLLTKTQNSCPSNAPNQKLPVVTINAHTVYSNDMSGVKPGQAVISGNVIVGIVESVSTHTATINFFNHFTNSLGVYLDPHLSGTLTTKDNLLTVTGLSNTVKVSDNAAIFTSGTEDLPRGLLLGTTKKIISLPSDTSQTTLVELAVPLPPENLEIITKF